MRYEVAALVLAVLWGVKGISYTITRLRYEVTKDYEDAQRYVVPFLGLAAFVLVIYGLVA